MNLQKLTIKNFRGIEHLEVEPLGKNLNIYGRNGTGKTTFADAFLWLLFGKDTFDRRDYDLIPHEADGAPCVGEGKEPFVEAVLDTVKLTKSLLEEWPKKGEMKGLYNGSTVHYFVDDLEVKAGEYTAEVAKIISVDVFKTIANPVYFMNLPWQERRKTLIKIAGDLHIPPLPEAEGRPFEQFYALSKQNVKTTRKQLDDIPVQIKEAKRSIPETLPTPLDMTALIAERKSLQEQLLKLKSTDVEAEKRKRIADVELKMAEAKAKHYETVDAKNAKIRAGITKLETELSEKKSALNEIVKQIAESNRAIESCRATRNALLDSYKIVSASVFDGELACPTCKRAYPETDVESAKASFNTKRATDLEQIKANGAKARTELEQAEQFKTELQAKYDAVNEEVDLLEQRLAKGHSMLVTVNFNTTDEFKTLTETLDRLTVTTLTQEDNGADAIQGKLNNLQVIIDGEARVMAILEQARSAQERIDTLMKQEQEVNSELSRWEKNVALCEDYAKRQSEALEETVNGVFAIAKFKMFATQKNGEEAECCDIIYPNGSTNLSTGERLQVGIDIINTLSEFYGVTAPIIIDNAESITKECPTSAQVIRLIVSEMDDKLRVEVVV